MSSRAVTGTLSGKARRVEWVASFLEEEEPGVEGPNWPGFAAEPMVRGEVGPCSRGKKEREVSRGGQYIEEARKIN